MTDQQNDNPVENTAQENEQQYWPSPGQKLKKLREELGYSREKVSEALYLTVHYVTALENDEFHKLPGHIFIKGYYRAYAGFLGADAEDVLNCYNNFIKAGDNGEQGENAGEASGSSGGRERRRSKNRTLVWVISVLLILALAAGLWLWIPRNANAAASRVAKYEDSPAHGVEMSIRINELYKPVILKV